MRFLTESTHLFFLRLRMKIWKSMKEEYEARVHFDRSGVEVIAEQPPLKSKRWSSVLRKYYQVC
jgi:hypothetical protein